MKVKDRNKVIFSILKELSENDYLPTYKDYNISEEIFVDIVKIMVKENYLNSDCVLFNILGKAEIDQNINTVTDNGLLYIEECEAWNVVYSNINDFNKLLDL